MQELEGGLLEIISAGGVAGNGGGIVLGVDTVGSGAGYGQTAIKSLLTNGANNGVADLAFATRNASTDIALTERMRITSGGTVLVGATNVDIGGAVDGIALRPDGSILSATSNTGISSFPLYVDRRGTNNVGTSIMMALGGFYKASIGVLGTNNSADDGGITLSTITGNTTVSERMRITASGNVGIGATAPTQTLTVSGSGTSNTAAIGGYQFGVYRGASADFSIGSDASYAYIQSWSNKPLQINKEGNNTYFNVAGGSIGVGTTSPGDKFDVFGTIRSSANSTYYSQLGYTNGTTVSMTTPSTETSDNMQFIINGGSTSTTGNAFVFKTQTGNTTPAEAMRITKAGNVGIGTSTFLSTVFKLQVGNGSADTRIVAAPNNQFALGVNNSGGGTFYIGANSSSATPDMVFSNSVGNERLRITDTGNLTMSSNTSTLLTLNSNTDSSGYAESGIYFTTNGTSYWEQFMATSAPDTMLWYSFTANTTRMSLTSAGTLTVVSLTQTSDARLKKDIVDIEGSALDKMSLLRPVTYHMNEDATDDPYRVGFIAQEVRSIFPELVVEGADENKTLSINYSGLIPYMTKAIQELSIKVKSLPDFEDPTLAVKVADFLRGIADGIARVDKVETKELCIGATCLTEVQLQQVLQQNNQPVVDGGTTTSPEPEPQPVPDVPPDPTPTPDEPPAPTSDPVPVTE